MMTSEVPRPVVHRERPLSFAMELRLLIERQRRIMRRLEAEQEIYPDKGDDNGK